MIFCSRSGDISVWSLLSYTYCSRHDSCAVTLLAQLWHKKLGLFFYLCWYAVHDASLFSLLWQDVVFFSVQRHVEIFNVFSKSPVFSRFSARRATFEAFFPGFSQQDKGTCRNVFRFSARLPRPVEVFPPFLSKTKIPVEVFFVFAQETDPSKAFLAIFGKTCNHRSFLRLFSARQNLRPVEEFFVFQQDTDPASKSFQPPKLFPPFLSKTKRSKCFLFFTKTHAIQVFLRFSARRSTADAFSAFSQQDKEVETLSVFHQDTGHPSLFAIFSKTFNRRSFFRLFSAKQRGRKVFCFSPRHRPSKSFCDFQQDVQPPKLFPPFLSKTKRPRNGFCFSARLQTCRLFPSFSARLADGLWKLFSPNLFSVVSQQDTTALWTRFSLFQQDKTTVL